MLVNQAAQAVNSITQAGMGEIAVLSEDLSNLVDVGTQIINSQSFDNFVRALPDAVTMVLFVDRIYQARTFGLYRNGPEWGAVTEKIDADLPVAEDSSDWMLENGQSYDPNVFHGPNVHVKFWNKFQTFTIKYSFARKQVKSAFSGPGPFMAFFNMLEVKVRNSSQLKMEGLARATMVGAMAEAINAGGAQVVHVLTDYNAEHPTATLTSANYRNNPDFLRYFAYKIKLVSNRMSDYSVLFNAEGRERFTPRDRQVINILSDVLEGANVYLQSDTFHNELTKLPEANAVNYWQGTGTGYDWTSISTIDVTSPSGATVSKAQVLGAILDYDNAGVTSLQYETRTQYNGEGDFINNWLEHLAGYRIDNAENCVVFVGD